MLEKSSNVVVTQEEKDQLDQGILPPRLKEEWGFSTAEEVLSGSTLTITKKDEDNGRIHS